MGRIKRLEQHQKVALYCSGYFRNSLATSIAMPLDRTKINHYSDLQELNQTLTAKILVDILDRTVPLHVIITELDIFVIFEPICGDPERVIPVIVAITERTS